MIVLVSGGPDRHQGDGIGRLVVPGAGNMPVAGIPWAADNAAFTNFDQEAYVRMLERLAGIPGCLFITAPDVVGDWQATLNMYDDYWWQIHDVGQPAAYVLQDGQPMDMVPWDTCEAVFIGGTTEWKLSAEASSLGQQAKARGKWLHMGRVNSRKRIRYAQQIGCDSIDGTSFSRWADIYIPQGRWLTAQMMLEET